MRPAFVKVVDGQNNTVATAQVEAEDNCFKGSVDLERMPYALRHVFEEYEDIVVNQLFSLLDSIEDRVAQLGLRVTFEDGREIHPQDLQIFPEEKTISFRVEKAITRTGR
jgi:hypothetical protein